METTPSFTDLGISPWITKRLRMIDIKTPTPVQANCIPEIIAGKDCIGAAKTGSGKTLAFALPIIQKLAEERCGIFAVILTPVRELAYQIADQFAIVGKCIDLRHTVIVGGMCMMEQARNLDRSPHVVIATPGRLADHIDGCMTFSLSNVRFVVFDEADRLLAGGFTNQIETIFGVMPKRRQNLFFSATITDALMKAKAMTPNNVFVYEAPAEIATVEQLEQHYLLCNGDVKDGYLVQLLREYREKDERGSIIIFTDSCKRCHALSIMLNEVGFDNIPLHSMLPQKQRLAALTKFKSQTVKILIATDVANRGLDLPAVQLVINQNVPKVPKEYIHRVGRTARAGRAGKAITLLVPPKDIPLLLEIEKHINTKLTEIKINEGEVANISTEVLVTMSKAFIEMNEKNFYEKRMINMKKKWILQGLDPDKEEKKLRKKKKKSKLSENKMEKAKSKTTIKTI